LRTWPRISSTSREAALALEALEKAGDEVSRVVLVGELLKEIASILENTRTAADASLEPEGIVEGRAVPAAFRGVWRCLAVSEKQKVA